MSLILNNEHFEDETLHQHCSEKLKNAATPEWERPIYQFILDWLSPADSMLLNTSGSTGKPKRINATKAAMTASARLTQEAFNLKENDKALLCLPACYIAGKMMIVRAFVCRLNLFTVEPDSAPLNKAPDHSFKLVSMVPPQLAHYQQTYSHEACLAYFKQIDTLLIGGAPIPKSVEAFIYNLHCKSFHTYGMTETFSHIALRRIQPNFTTYQTLPGVTVTTNAANCLIIKAPPFSIDALATTDIAQIHSDTEFTLIGRADNTINTGGIKVQPEDVERKIEAAFKQHPVLIFPSKDDKWGQQINLAIEAHYDDHLERHITALLQNLKTLNKYERPKKIVFTEQFVYTKFGKLQRTKTIQKLTERRGYNSSIKDSPNNP